MNIKDYALTKQNLAYIGILDPFYSVYSEYKNIVSAAFDETLSVCGSQKVDIIKIVREKTRHDIRKLFEEFLDTYTDIFVENQLPFHVNLTFLNMIEIIKTEHGSTPLSIEVSIHNFSYFLNRLEEAVAALDCNRREKQASHKINYDYVFITINRRIAELAKAAKLKMTAQPEYTQEICDKLYVYENLKLISCNQKRHDILSQFVYCRLESGKTVGLPIHKCMTCGKQFIDALSLSIYEKTFGKIIVSKEKDNEKTDFGLSEESELYKSGYNARENGMNDLQRQAHLKMLIDTKQMSCFDIIRDLKNAIILHENNSLAHFAVEKWKRDLAFVNRIIETNSHDE